MNFSVSNAGIKWYVDFGPDSVILILEDLVRGIRTSSIESALAACCCLKGETFRTAI